MIDETDGAGAWSYHGLCPKCGKPYIYIGDVPDGGFTKGLEPYCTCNENNYTLNKDLSNIFISGNQGWICPKCSRVFSPTVFECVYCNNTNITSTWSSTDTVIRDENDDTQLTYSDTKNKQIKKYDNIENKKE